MIEDDMYCQLKYSCSFGFPENSLLEEPKIKETHCDYPGKFYVETYNNFSALINRIKNLYNLLIEAYKSKNINIYSKQCSFHHYVVCNKYGDHQPIGVSPYGWDISIYFNYYLLKYFKSIYGNENGIEKYYELTNGNEVFFYLHNNVEPFIAIARELVSEDMASIILKKFLETGREEIAFTVYSREIAKRRYLK